MRVVGMSIVTVVCAVAAPGVAGAGVTRAEGGPPPSAVAQYIEAVPTSSGDHVPGSRQTGHQTVQPQAPSPQVARTIERQGGSDAPALVRIVSSPDYGAPTHAPAHRSAIGSPAALATRDPNVFSAAFGGGSSHDVALFIGALALITCAAVVVTVVRRRLRRLRG